MGKTKKKDKIKTTFSQKMQNVCSFYVFLYLFFMAVYFPFFLTWGYRNAGTDKAMLSRYLGLGLILSVLPCALIYWLIRLKKKGMDYFYEDISDSDWLGIAYLFLVVISYLCSDNKQEALWGTRGWYIGLVTQIIYLASYFFISRFLKGERILLPLLGIGSGISFFLGISNRFSVYPLKLEGANASFIATLGNINWFCGYWSVFFPLAAGLFYGMRGKNRVCRLFCGVYLALCAGTGAVQGSDSALLVYGAVILLLFCISCKSNEDRKGFYETMLVVCGACQIVRLIRLFFPEAMNYKSMTAGLLTEGNFTLFLFTGALLLWLLYFALEKEQKDMGKFMKGERVAVLVLLLLVFGGFLFLLIRNTTEPGSIGALSENKIFLFNEEWGSSRGATWTAGLKVFNDQPFGRKLIGLGPDSFAYGVYQEGSSAAQMVMEEFGSSRLTNAHNEWITVLVNTGVLGMLFYIGFFFSKAARYIKERDNSPVVLACGLALAGYMSHNLFSFQQALNGPFVFIMMGIGEAVLRRDSIESNSPESNSGEHEFTS